MNKNTQELIKATEGHFGQSVLRITAPGGKRRDSVRIHFEDRSVIATQRDDPEARLREIDLLSKLSKETDRIPEFLGATDTVLFQEDVGGMRLSVALNQADTSEQKQIAKAAMEALSLIKQAAAQREILRDCRTVGFNHEWLKSFVSTPQSLSNRLSVDSPAIDIEPLVQALVGLPLNFVKWDARPGNASIQPDGTVRWFDWEHYGRRTGGEDYSVLMADEYWPLSAKESVNVMQNTVDVSMISSMEILRLFCLFHIIRRIMLIHIEYERFGWGDLDDLQKYDRIGRSKSLVIRQCEHGREWAAQSDKTIALINWFDQIEAALTTNNG